ncbi:right-handed parallel beta-helix repeat-containing protein, partial [Paenibacillus sepulcri]|nr:right-handed parallel beta-helix repeat-containing protein [Paenibacillus sepulcri]
MPTEEKGTLPAAAVIQLTDYGVLPDSGADAMVPMQRAIEAASRIEGPVMLECQTGRYDFHPEHATRTPYYISNTASEEENPDVTKTIGILFKGMKDIVMEGNGSLFVFHGKQTMIVIDSCENVTISCVHTEYERPTVAEMTIEESGSDYFDVRIHPDFRYELEAGRLYFLGDGWRFREGPMQEYDPVIDKTWRIDNLMEKAVRVEELEPYRLRLHMEAAPNQVVGRVLQVRDGLRDQVGAFILKSRDITWENVGMHFMHGLGIVCQYSENLSFDRLNLAPRPET